MDANQKTFWSVLDTFISEHGLLGFVLLGVIWVFWKLIWKVWSSAMQSKDDEIKRLVEERNWLQDQLYGGKRLSSRVTPGSED